MPEIKSRQKFLKERAKFHYSGAQETLPRTLGNARADLLDILPLDELLKKYTPSYAEWLRACRDAWPGFLGK